MSKFSFRCSIALITFVTGVIAVSLLHPRPNSPGTPSTPVTDLHSGSIPYVEEVPDEWESYFGTPLVWKFLMNDDVYGKIAVVRATRITESGNVRAKLKLDCPGKYSAITIIVGDMESSGFDLANYSMKSDLPVNKRNFIEIRAVSPNGPLSFKTEATGRIAYDNFYPTVIFFEVTHANRLERLIAKGSVEVTFVIHDLKDFQKTITVTFPAIDPSGEIAKDLKGCR